MTKKELIDYLKDIPDDAEISITVNGNCQEAVNVQYNELGNEIILSDEDIEDDPFFTGGLIIDEIPHYIREIYF